MQYKKEAIENRMEYGLSVIQKLRCSASAFNSKLK